MGPVQQGGTRASDSAAQGRHHDEEGELAITRALPISLSVRSRVQAIDEAAAKPAASASPTGVAITKPALRRSSSTPGGGQRVQPQEARGDQERERDQEQARVAAPADALPVA